MNAVFFITHYNYWMVILLMMAGLYVVLARGNLVKKLIGLNVFQTSVFLLYISMGKIIGGTAPIEVGGHGGGHGESHEGEGAHGAGHGVADSPQAANAHSDPQEHADSSEGDVSARDAESTEHSEEEAETEATAEETTEAPADKDTVAQREDAAQADASSADTAGVESGQAADHALNDSGPEIEGADGVLGDATDALGDAAAAQVDSHAAMDSLASGAHDVIYSNPLPHVLILTAIVVGVATLAVGLAIIVRIREAYGTIEEDEIVAADHAAEFGEAARRT